MPQPTLLLGVLFIAGSLGCEGPRQEAPLDNATVNAGLDPENPRILALVDYFETKGIQLVHDRGGWWRVTRPPTPKVDVIVSLRSFPESASAYQMRDALTRINLAYLLNAGARVAMSYPGLRGARPGAITDVRIVQLQTRLERLFQEYRPASANPAAQSMATQWKSVVYASRAGGTGAGSLRARTSDLIHLSAPRQVAIRAVFRYSPKTDAWERLFLDPLPSICRCPLPGRSIQRRATRCSHHSPSSPDVMLGPPPPGRVAMCVPFADRAEARFVPDPSRL
jgi:hypothetical protein